MSYVTKAALLAVTSLTLAAGTAQAGSISYTASTPSPTTYQSTDFTTAVSISKFDPSLGTLNSIGFSLGGGISGTIQVESLDASATTINSKLSSTITLKRPDGTAITFTTPAATFADSVTSYDGTLDFGGTSGRTHANIIASGSASTTSTAAADLALFTGASGYPGTIHLAVNAAGLSTATGAGNLVTSFTTAARADVTVTYNYTDAVTRVPEPASTAMLGAGLLGVGLYRRRRA